ncbi:MAG TPA: DUF3592 domain-containing protein [Blastocatellia bacterium]|nr:DUF3592 domain-containing protein [Blastocatellia bacterium]
MSNSWNNITFLMLGAIMLVVTVPTAFMDWYNVKGIWMYMSYPSSFKLTEGRIVSSSTYTSLGRSKQGNWSTISHFAIEYEFTVDGKSYRSDKVNFSGDIVPYQEIAELYVEKYPVGKTVTVYYNSYDPTLSVLQPKKKGILPMLLLGFVIASVLVFGLSAGYWLIKKAFFPKNSSPPPMPDGYEEAGRYHRDG